MKSGHNVLDAYHFILKWAKDHKGNTPSQRQIALACDFAIGTAHTCVSALIKEGLLERIDGDLCVVKADFALDPDAYDIPAKEKARHLTNMTNMNVIPSDMSDEDHEKLAKMGVRVGKSINDLFAAATYPPDWYYEEVQSPDQEAYLLTDNTGTYRGVAHYHGKDKERGVTFTVLNG